MLLISKNDDGYVANCGKARCLLPVIERTDSDTGLQVTEIISASGIKGLFRTVVDIEYTPMRIVQEDGESVSKWIPKHRIYDRLDQLVMKLANDYYPGQIVRISRMNNPLEAGAELEKILSKVLNRLAKESWDASESTSFETLANSQQAILLDGKLPSIKGKFLAEIDAHRRIEAAKSLMNAGLLSSPCATGTGDPGKSYYLSGDDGYSLAERTNPLVKEMPEKRRGVVNAIKNCVSIVGAEPSPVNINGVNQTPPMANAVVACMPLALDDSVIISESLAAKLTARVRRSNYHNIDGVINYRGGYRSTGRNGALIKRASEWPIRFDRKEDMDGNLELRQRMPLTISNLKSANPDAKLLCELRAEYEAKWAGLIQKLGAYTAEECGEWKAWLAHQPRWTQRNSYKPLYRKHSCGVERIVNNGEVMYREDLGWHYRKPEVGMKLQSDGDLFKGVVSKILPDEKMPMIRLSGKMVRAEVVCEMGASTAKHGSLRFAHGQMALYAIAQHIGGIGIVEHPALEDIADMAVESGVYDSDDLTCETFDCNGKVSYGCYPAGVIRVGRHRQDPSVVSAVKGHSADRPWMESTSIRSGGTINGLPDTMCMLAAGLKECARELRSEIPSSVMLKLELLRNAIC